MTYSVLRVAVCRWISNEAIEVLQLQLHIIGKALHLIAYLGPVSEHSSDSSSLSLLCPFYLSRGSPYSALSFNIIYSKPTFFIKRGRFTQ